MKSFYLKSLLIFLSLSTAKICFAGSAQVRLNPQSGELGQELNLQVSISGSLSGDVKLPPIQDVEIRSTGSSTSISIINGSFSKQTSYNFSLEALKEGEYTIPSLKLKIDGEWINTEALTFTIHPSGMSPPPSQNPRGNSQARAQRGNPNPQEDSESSTTQSANVFIERTFSKTSPYEGEPIVVTTKIYHKIPIANVESYSDKAQGVRVLDIKQYETQEQRGNELYDVVAIQQTLIPLRSGKIKIPPFRIKATLMTEIRRQGQRSNNPFDDFFDDFFNGASSRMEKRAFSSKEQELDIKTVPNQGRPDKFKDLVGIYRIYSELSHNELKAGDTATLSITIDGVGALDSMGSLDLALGPDIRIYPDKPQVQEKAHEKHGLESKRTFRFALVPIHKGEYKLGTLKIPYFDLSTNSYQELNTDLGVLKVAEGDVSQVVAGAANTTAIEARTDVKSIANDLIDLHRRISLNERGTLTKRDCYLASFLVGLPALLCLLLLSLRGIRNFIARKQNSRQKTAWKNFEKRMSQLNRSAEASQLIENSYRAYRDYVGDKLDLHGRALTIKELSVELSKRKVSAKLISELQDLAKMVEEIQYTSYSLPNHEAEGLVEKMQKLARELEKQC